MFFERTYFNSDSKMNTTLCVAWYKQALNKTTRDIQLFNWIFFLFYARLNIKNHLLFWEFLYEESVSALQNYIHEGKTLSV